MKLAAWLVALGWVVSMGASAQDSIGGPVKMIVPAVAGGGVDVVARAVATKLSPAIGQPVIIDNRGGGSGIPGIEAVGRAAPDGQTVLIATMGQLAINPALYRNRKLPYNIDRDFVPVSLVAAAELMLMVNPGVPVKNMAEFLAYAKAQNGKLQYGSSGIGGGPHLTMELLAAATGVKFSHVPYKGSTPAFTDALGGHVPVLLDTLVGGLQYVRSGKLRAIAVLSGQRSGLLPDVPTVAETVPNFAVTNWYGLMVPTGTPAGIQKLLHEQVAKILADPALKAEFVRQGIVLGSGTQADFARFLKAETARWAKIVVDNDVAPD